MILLPQDTKRVRFNPEIRVVNLYQKYPKYGYDTYKCTKIPMRLHRSQTYIKVVMGKYYCDFLEFSNTYPSEFSNILRSVVMQLTGSIPEDKLFNAIFECDEKLVSLSIENLLEYQTQWFAHNQSAFRMEMWKFMNFLIERNYPYSTYRYFSFRGKLSMEQIYFLLCKKFKLHIVHPDLVT